MTNLLLNLLPPGDQVRLQRECDLVRLTQRDILVETDEPIQFAYFPISGVISQLVVLSDGNAVESAVIGREGYLGLSAHYARELSPARFVVQTPGEAWRIATTNLNKWALELPRLQTFLARYNDCLLAMASQLAACNRLHNVVERCARWLLSIQERQDEQHVPVTQEVLSQMLGVRRASISLAAGVLQEAGIIRYSYGRMEILDPVRLEAMSCECAFALRRRCENLFASLMG